MRKIAFLPIDNRPVCYQLPKQIADLDGENEILHQRFIERLDKNRHYVHKSQDFTNINDFIPVINHLRCAPYFGEVIKVNCNDFSYQTDECLFKKIEEFINKQKSVSI